MAKRIASAVAVLVVVFQSIGSSNLAAQGPQEGIKVHGHWTIDVRNADGTLATHRAFDNALITAHQGQGDFVLSGLLAGALTLSDWSIYLTNFPAGNPSSDGNFQEDPSLAPCEVYNVPIGCTIRQPMGSNVDSLGTFWNLRIAASNGSGTAGDLLPPGVFVSPYAMVMVGSATASRDGWVGGVQTRVFPCASGAEAGQAGCSRHKWFSQAFVKDDAGNPHPIQVHSGQIIQVRVVISFS